MKSMTLECLEPWPAAISGRSEVRWRCNHCRMEGTQNELAGVTCTAGANHPPPYNELAVRRHRGVVTGILPSRDDFGPVPEYPSAVRCVAYDGLGRCRVDETHPNGASAVDVFEKFIGGTLTFLDATTGNKIWEVTRL